MKKIILTLSLFLSTFAYANTTNLPIQCVSVDEMLTVLKDQAGEELVFITKSYNTNGQTLSHSLWLNSETNTWSFIVVNKELDGACMIASGDNYSLLIESFGL